MPVDPEDVVVVALDYAVRDLQRLSRRLAEPSMVWEHWWHLLVASMASPTWSFDDLNRTLLAVTRRCHQDLLSAL